MIENQFPVSERNQVRQASARGVYDEQTIYKILDQTLVCNIGFIEQGAPVVIPILFARDGNKLLFHGSTKSRLMRVLASGQQICVSTTLMDGLVLAKSLFHHSMNYRSVTVFGTGHLLSDFAERLEALRVITDKVMPGRWNDARQPNRKEMKATAIVALTIETGSAKVRTGSPNDDKDDLSLPVWSGVVPMRLIAEMPLECDNGYSATIAVPDYLRSWRTRFNQDSAKPDE